MSDFSSGDKTTKGSTQAAGGQNTTHQFTGSILVQGLVSASMGISASTFVGDGSGLSGVGGGGGATSPAGSDRQIQYNDGGGFGANAGLKFTSNGLLSASYGAMFGEAVSISAQDTGIALTGSLSASKGAVFGENVIISAGGDALFVSGAITAVNNMFLTGTMEHTGTLNLSGTLTITGVEATPMLVLDDTDASAQIGRAHVGYVGSSDFAAFAHQDNADTSNYCISQRSTGQTDINTRAGTNMTFRYASATRMQLDQNGGFAIGANYAPAAYKLDVSGSTRLGTDETMTLHVTGAIDQSGSTSTFHIPDGNAGAFVISGSSDTGQGDPENGLYFGVNTAAKKVRTSADFIIDGQKKLWLGTGSLLSNPESGEGNGYVTWGTGESALIIESTSGSTNGIKLSGSVTAPQIASGSIAGPGSYVGVSGDGLLVLTASSGGGGGSPGGSDTQIQFNDGGSFGGEANLTYEKTQSTLFVSASQSIFSGSTIITGSAAVGTAPSYDGQGGDGIALKVEGGGASSDQGKPVLVCQVTGTQNSGDVGYVGIGTAAPKVQLDIRWNPDLDPNTGGGDVVSFATGTTSPGALYYLNDGGGWVSASAANTGSGNDQLLGIALGNDAQQDGMLIKGWADVSNFYQDSFRAGKAVYIASASSAADEGKMSGSAPTAADSYARIVGYASPNASTIYFNPGTSWIELS